MKRLVVLAVLAVLVAVAASTALGRNTSVGGVTGCAKGAVARIGGKSVCLHSRMACKAAYKGIYKRHGFTCVAGQLRKTPKAKTKPKPPAPTPTPTPPPYAPPTGPVGTANTTVAVELYDSINPGSIVLSQTTIPSGMVTFVITNECINGPCSFDLQGVKAGAILNNTGQSETWTVALAPGIYRYHCDVDPTMKGSFTVTP
jgi:hypothetical protein